MFIIGLGMTNCALLFHLFDTKDLEEQKILHRAHQLAVQLFTVYQNLGTIGLGLTVEVKNERHYYTENNSAVQKCFGEGYHAEHAQDDHL